MIVITNDDGPSNGAKTLLMAAQKFDDAYALLPEKQRSVISGALTLHKPLRLKRRKEKLYTLNGNPGDCVLFALYSNELPKPDLVLSGINWGDNSCAESLFTSGTLGACWHAIKEGVPAIAFSLRVPHREWTENRSWGDLDKLQKTVEKVLEELRPKLKPHAFFNVNIPPTLGGEIKYINKLQLSKWKTVFEKRSDPEGKKYYWLTGIPQKAEENTDFYELDINKKITISEVTISQILGEDKC